MPESFNASWDRAWRGLPARGDGADIHAALLVRYAEPHRKYHTLQHLGECLALFEAEGAAAEHPHEVEMALWFHDGIYEVKASDNESKSAAWAHEALVGADVAAEIAGRIRDLILVTRHTGVPRTQDEKFLMDIDLSILGAPRERFDEYDRQIREEYSYVPGFIYRMKRKAILQSFLDRPAIFSTPAMHARLETTARENLARAIGE